MKWSAGTSASSRTMRFIRDRANGIDFSSLQALTVSVENGVILFDGVRI